MIMHKEQESYWTKYAKSLANNFMWQQVIQKYCINTVRLFRA